MSENPSDPELIRVEVKKLKDLQESEGPNVGTMMYLLGVSREDVEKLGGIHE